MGKYSSDIKKYYGKLGDMSGDKAFKDYTTELSDQASEGEGEGDE